jgi:hypothetical protein
MKWDTAFKSTFDYNLKYAHTVEKKKEEGLRLTLFKKIGCINGKFDLCWGLSGRGHAWGGLGLGHSLFNKVLFCFDFE